MKENPNRKTKKLNLLHSKYSVYNSSVDKEGVFGVLLKNIPKFMTVLAMNFEKHNDMVLLYLL